jgi:hypothetical protein
VLTVRLKAYYGVLASPASLRGRFLTKERATKMVCKCDKIASLEALIEELRATDELHLLAAKAWVGHDKWNDLTPEQKRNNIKLAKHSDEVRRNYLETFIW